LSNSGSKSEDSSPLSGFGVAGVSLPRFLTGIFAATSSCSSSEEDEEEDEESSSSLEESLESVFFLPALRFLDCGCCGGRLPPMLFPPAAALPLTPIDLPPVVARGVVAGAAAGFAGVFFGAGVSALALAASTACKAASYQSLAHGGAPQRRPG
jgi:hypothetical protein